MSYDSQVEKMQPEKVAVIQIFSSGSSEHLLWQKYNKKLKYYIRFVQFIESF